MTTLHTPPSWVLTVSCLDAAGIVGAVGSHLGDRGLTITESQQYGDPHSRTFFMRVRFAPADATDTTTTELRSGFERIAARFGMTWRLVDAQSRSRVLIMVSKFAHCMNDLLYRTSVGELPIEVVGVVSNHPDTGRLADSYGVPFRHIPVTPDTKAAAEAELLELVREERIDLVVLARYMQILSDDLCKQLENNAINIHHSMLPSFKGARPYHQAHARGVKVIGATAHYVTADLDEGPIIAQETAPVDHSLTADEYAARGREVESRALARAVRWHTENRIVVNGRKTVVLR